MRTNKRLWALLCAITLLAARPAALAAAADDGENDGGMVWVMYDPQGRRIASRAGRMYEGDGLISGDNVEYVVVSVDDESRVAYAELASQTVAVSSSASKRGGAQAGEGGKKLICMYCTHSDESYEPSDGDYSLARNAGIFDVSAAFAKNLEELGVTVERSEDTFLPHDAGAYRRSRATTEEYAKKAPDAIFDIHRDGIPDAGEYEKTVKGEDVTQVRLLVGRSNENSDVNKAFAKELKAQADELYPGLIRDIYIGKGNYNQELYPKALLLEFGTYSNDKQQVIDSTQMMARVVTQALYGDTSQGGVSSQGEKAMNRGALKGVAWTAGLLAAGGLAYALISTGTLRNWREKLSSGTSELTGGLLGGSRRKGGKEK